MAMWTRSSARCIAPFEVLYCDLPAHRAMLADRLLAKTDYDCDRELRTLELLKVRFGEANLHNAEVMLRVSSAVALFAGVRTPLV